jgi:ATP-dependent HslUV protease ATP-binding subunit HslU
MDYFISLILLDAMLGPEFNDLKLREDKLKNLEKGLYDDLFINIDIPNTFDDTKYSTVEEYLDSLPKNLPKQGAGALNLSKSAERFTGKLSDARTILQTIFIHQLGEKIDLKKKAISEIENEGIIFIDEIDKIVMSNVDRA